MKLWVRYTFEIEDDGREWNPDDPAYLGSEDFDYELEFDLEEYARYWGMDVADVDPDEIDQDDEFIQDLMAQHYYDAHSEWSCHV